MGAGESRAGDGRSSCHRVYCRFATLMPHRRLPTQFLQNSFPKDAASTGFSTAHSS
jgi:hypothetical protein